MRYGSPAHITLAISPTHLATGHYDVPVQLVATGRCTAPYQNGNIGPTIGEKFSRNYFPTIFFESPAVPVANTAIDFTWETDDLDNRIRFGSFNASLYVTLPFTITLPDGQIVNDGRLYADGFLELPNISHNVILTATECLPTPAWPIVQADKSQLWWPQQAIFGWWADLDTSVAGAQVSTFQPGSNRVVFEFAEVQIVDSGEKVSFQIVLYDSGRIDLNYLRTPSTILANANATVGVSLQDSRFYNLVGCKDATQEIGVLPQSGQSLIFQLADIY
ncbi:MAG: hypothetical protein R2911_24740 [Caldilineaceae bacterium]